jgi:predicted small lipoprotein YifL
MRVAAIILLLLLLLQGCGHKGPLAMPQKPDAAAAQRAPQNPPKNN